MFSFAMKAEGVRGGVKRRREMVVVCDFRRVVEAVITERGSGISVVDVEEVVEGFEGISFEGARED